MKKNTLFEVVSKEANGLVYDQIEPIGFFETIAEAEKFLQELKEKQLEGFEKRKFHLKKDV